MCIRDSNKGAWGGDGCWWIWIILLFFCWGGFGGNGFGNNANGLPAQLNGDAGRELLMNAIQGNGTAINQLASSLNCSTTQLQGAICNLQGSIDKVAGQIGMTGQQVINAIQAGNCQLSAQIAECCCNVRTAIDRQGYDSQLAVCNQTNTLVGTANQNTLALRDAGTANTNAIIGKLDQMQNQALQDKIDAPVSYTHLGVLLQYNPRNGRYQVPPGDINLLDNSDWLQPQQQADFPNDETWTPGSGLPF